MKTFAKSKIVWLWKYSWCPAIDDASTIKYTQALWRKHVTNLIFFFIFDSLKDTLQVLEFISGSWKEKCEELGTKRKEMSALNRNWAPLTNLIDYLRTEKHYMGLRVAIHKGTLFSVPISLLSFSVVFLYISLATGEMDILTSYFFFLVGCIFLMFAVNIKHVYHS